MSAPVEPALTAAPAWLSSAGSALALIVYQFIFLLAFLVYSPVLVWRLIFDPRYRGGLAARMGWAPLTRGPTPVIWIHAVSVGELKAARQLIDALLAHGAQREVVISSTTPTGRQLARQLYPTLRTFYYPLDFGLCPWLALRRVRPAAVLLVELEYWPNFLFCAARRRVPVAVINGRISEKSFRGYRRIRGLAPPFGAITRFCMQDESYRRRLLDLGVDGQRIFVTGNMKYDAVRIGQAPAAAGRVRRWLLGDESTDRAGLVLVCGSTHADEERTLLDIASRLQPRLDGRLRIVLAPRHPERAGVVSEVIAAAGRSAVSWSQSQSTLPPLAATDVVLVDTIGHLETFYAAGDVAFVGGSLIPRGGQNMLEPAALGKAVVFGPHTSNFRNDVELLLGAGAAEQVASAADLEMALLALLSDPRRRAELGQRAVELIARNRGATARTLGLLESLWVAGGTGQATTISRKTRINPKSVSNTDVRSMGNATDRDIRGGVKRKSAGGDGRD